MIRACIFDFDGTLADTLTTISHFLNRALSECGYPTLTKEDFRYLVGNGADRLIRDTLAAVGSEVTEARVLALRRAYDNGYDNAPLHLTAPYDGVCELLTKLKERGILLAVLSNKPHYLTAEITTALFPDTFDLCYGQRAEVARKPAPDGALQIAEALRVLPEECLYLGDSGVDMKTGTAARMKTVGVCWGFRTREELLENGAEFLVTHPLEILDLL